MSPHDPGDEHEETPLFLRAIRSTQRLRGRLERTMTVHAYQQLVDDLSFHLSSQLSENSRLRGRLKLLEATQVNYAEGYDQWEGVP